MIYGTKINGVILVPRTKITGVILVPAFYTRRSSWPTHRTKWNEDVQSERIQKFVGKYIALLPHARLMDLPRRTRRSSQSSHGKNVTWITWVLLDFNLNLFEGNNPLNILADNMFWNYFLIYYRRHKCFVQFLYSVLLKYSVSVFLITISVYYRSLKKRNVLFLELVHLSNRW